MERRHEETEATLRDNIHKMSSEYAERESEFEKIGQALRGQIS